MAHDPSTDDLTALQRAVMELVWELGAATVHDLLGRLGDERPVPYTSVLSALQTLEKGGWVTHHARGRRYLYTPTRPKPEPRRRSLRRLLRDLFQGNPLLLFRQLLDDEKLSDDELKELDHLIRERRKQRRRPPDA
jgi:predicted transcriptional regulator